MPAASASSTGKVIRRPFSRRHSEYGDGGGRGGRQAPRAVGAKVNQYGNIVNYDRYGNPTKMDAYGRHEIGVGAVRPHQPEDNIPMTQPYDPSRFDAFFHKQPMANGLGVQPMGNRRFNQVDETGAVTDAPPPVPQPGPVLGAPVAPAAPNVGFEGLTGMSPPPTGGTDAYAREQQAPMKPGVRSIPIAPQYRAPGGPANGIVRFDLPPDAPMTINGVTKTPESHPDSFDMNAVKAYRESLTTVPAGGGGAAAGPVPVGGVPQDASLGITAPKLPGPTPSAVPAPSMHIIDDDEKKRRQTELATSGRKPEAGPSQTPTPEREDDDF